MDHNDQHNSNKSNRAGADYFELMVIKCLTTLFKIPFIYETELSQVTEEMLSIKDGDQKKKLQDENYNKAIPLIQDIMYQYPLTKTPDKVVWTGRMVKKGSEDLIIESSADNIQIKISLKSTTRGDGTLKNVGQRMLRQIGIDISEEYSVMKSEVIKKLSITHPELIKEDLSLSKVKEISRTNTEIEESASKFSEEFIKEINYKVANELKKKSTVELKSFLNEKILSLSSNEDLWVISVNTVEAKMWNQKESLQIKDSEKLSLEISDLGFKILKDGEKFLRANTCCTNGKGLSAVCQRYFLDLAKD